MYNYKKIIIFEKKMILFVDYNTLKIKRKSNLKMSDVIINTRTQSFDNNVVIHTSLGFYFDDSLLESDDEWFNRFIETDDYKIHMRKIKLEKLNCKNYI